MAPDTKATDDPVAELFARAEATAPPAQDFLSAAERHELVQRGTPFYVGAVAIQDGTYGVECVYSIYVDPKAGEIPEPRKLSLKANPARENFARATNDALKASDKALGPFYLVTVGAASEGRSPRYEIAPAPQAAGYTGATQRFDPDATLRPFK